MPGDLVRITAAHGLPLALLVTYMHIPALSQREKKNSFHCLRRAWAGTGLGCPHWVLSFCITPASLPMEISVPAPCLPTMEGQGMDIPYSPTWLAAPFCLSFSSTWHFFLAILWRIEAFSLNLPEARESVRRETEWGGRIARAGLWPLHLGCITTVTTHSIRPKCLSTCMEEGTFLPGWTLQFNSQRAASCWTVGERWDLDLLLPSQVLINAWTHQASPPHDTPTAEMPKRLKTHSCFGIRCSSQICFGQRLGRKAKPSNLLTWLWFSSICHYCSFQRSQGQTPQLSR